MTEPAYPAARAVAPIMREQFARRFASARERGKQALAFEPDEETIEAAVDAAFWASLRREEGYAPKISLAFLPPEQAGRPLEFERRVPLAPSALARIAPAVERPGIHLGIWREREELYVWGTTRTLPLLCFVLEVVAPGLLVIKYRRGKGPSKFANVAVLEGDRIKVVDEQSAGLPDCPELLTSLLGFDTSSLSTDSVNVLVQLAVSMRAHGRGGSLLVVPKGADGWRESIVQPITYAVSPAFTELAELLRQEPDEEKRRGWQEALRSAVDATAGLTAVDGAAVINNEHELLAFGAKIGRRGESARVSQVVVTEPVVGSTASFLAPTELGGTRHMSAAQFVQDQRDSVALVASQDGRFTIFAWSPCEEMVHAHRVETLLL
jgi:hypothetical protein